MSISPNHNYWPTAYADLNFELPENLIATQPVSPADRARLMVVDREKSQIHHDHFFNLGKYLVPADTIFYNATRVEERRVYVRKQGGDKTFECVFLKRSGRSTWQVLMRNVRRLKDGSKLTAVKDSSYEFSLSRQQDLIFLESLRPLLPADFSRIGEMPIPPYMRRAADTADENSYQNFFRDQIAEKDRVAGSAASPTAALHFTTSLHESLMAAGVEFFPVCLDIGYGTFAPLTGENFEKNQLHAEHYFIPPATLERFNAVPGRKIALGTTSLRALLSLQKYGLAESETEIFLKPGDQITGVDALITNFHLPQSSLILLTAAFCGEKLLLDAYHEAIRNEYRFYSYGDALLIL